MSVTSGPGREPPNWQEIKVPPIFTNPTEKAYLQGYEDGWESGVDKYLEELPEEGYFLFVKGLLKAWIINWDSDPKVKEWMASVPGFKFWDADQRSWVLKFLDKPEAREALKPCLEEARKAFLQGAVHCIESVKDFPGQGGSGTETPHKPSPREKNGHSTKLPPG